MLAVVGLQRIGVGSAYAYVIPGAIVWAGLLMTGAHPTLAGVVLGLMTPVMSRRLHEQPPVVRVQAALHPWVAYIVMPRSEEHTSQLQSLMRISYAVFCLKTKTNTNMQNKSRNN